MRGRLLGAFLAFAVVVTVALEVPLGLSMQTRQQSSTISALRRDGTSLSVLLSDALDHDELDRAVALASRYAGATGRQVVVIQNGAVLLTSGSGATRSARDPALAKALKRARSRTVSGETSGDPNGSLLYVALPLRAEGHASRVTQVLLVTLPAGVVNSEIRHGWLKLGVLGLIVLLGATVLALAISASLIRPLRRIEAAVDAIGGGSLEVRAPDNSGPAELRRLAGAINSTAERLIRLLEAQRSFAADASHQLRTPLTALRLRLENLQPLDGSAGSRDVTAALAELARLSRLVEALLTLARGDGEQPVLVPVDVGGVVRERLEVWRPLADEQQLELDASVDSNASCLSVLAWPEALEQVLDNLLANAFEATPRGGRVRIEVHHRDTIVEIHVIDNGPGLAPAERERAFDRFWRGRTSGHEGAGLGLAIVEQLVRASGGSAALQAAGNGGIDATIRLQAA
ncbi:MAG TPA: HAMP domain-containing sensor histidine kinase [Acidimicrobiales bacterium]|nr:HAMP domain-containing sensor histidine kinase [Acidimicrobiales bacterium]